MSEQPAPPQGAPLPMRSRLTRAVIEVEAHAAAEGWDGPVRLFALVPTAELLEREPRLAAALGVEAAAAAAGDPNHLTPVEQEGLPEAATLEDLLAQVAWPANVLGAAVVVERVMLPPEAEAGMPQDEQEALRWIGEHPQRQEVRLAVGVLRDGSRECALRFREHDRDDAVLSGPDLVPSLAEALAATLAD
ncbi:MAG: PPA1309 family protein [Motilibacteraceae bacterium]